MSKGEDELGELLAQTFKQHVEPQYSIKVDRQTLFLDYYIPTLRLAFEFDGIQHTRYVPFMHGSRQGFEASQARDARKETWCNENGVTLVRINFNEKVTANTLHGKIQQILSARERGH